MKALGIVALVVVVAVGGFVALTAFVLSRGEDQSALTQQVELVVTDEQESRDQTTGSGYDLTYSYEVDGQWYAGERRIRDNYWSPGQALTACVDPASPVDHVVTIRMERCGQETIVGGAVQQGAPASAP